MFDANNISERSRMCPISGVNARWLQHPDTKYIRKQKSEYSLEYFHP